jgi:hypothetical protein
MTVKLNAADLSFILRQIKISEAHSDGTALTDIWVDANGNVVPAGTPGAVQALSDPHVPYGLRTVDGTYNNLVEGREAWGASDQPMPRLLDPNWQNDADGDQMQMRPGAGLGPVTNNDYGVIGAPTTDGSNGGHSGNVADADPRIISNLVVDQSIDNPAAVAAWFANDAAIAAFHVRYGDDAIPVLPGEVPPQPAVLNAGFEERSLDGEAAGVNVDTELGNWHEGAPDGWELTGPGTGGTYAPTAAVIDQTGIEGGNVAWITDGATLAQDVGEIADGASYTFAFRVGDRTDQVWSGGSARMLAVSPDGMTTVFLAQTVLPQPQDDGQWADVSLVTAPLPAALAGYTLRIEIQQTGSESANGQILIDGVSVTSSLSNMIAIDNIDLANLPNIAPDDGISAPFNAWMTFFGQFFDHGLDLISKGDNGTVFIPLQADDPLIAGRDGVFGTADDLAAGLRFMALTRATPTAGPGPDGIMGTVDDTVHEGNNTTTPFVDQNQTYTSHASHQVFVRDYKMVDGVPVATGKLLDGENGGLPTWADVKKQAVEKLGIQLSDEDVLNVPLLRTDPYGEFIRDANGFAQVVIGLGPDGIPNTDDDIVASGTPEAPVVLSTLNGGLGPVRTAHAFLDDIAHAATPGGGRTADADFGVNDANANGIVDAGDTFNDANGNGQIDPGEGHVSRTQYDNELLDRHFITGDGRGNENIGLTAVHHVFHQEHNRQVAAQKLTILDTEDIGFINEWLTVDISAEDLAGYASMTALQKTAFADGLGWDGERLFQAGRFATEMQYQHLVFEEFGRKIHPNIDPFIFNNVTDINPAIFAEFANVVYRFGHSMLTDSMPRVFADGSTDDMGLITSFLNPVAYDNDMTLTADEAAAAVIRGMTAERGSAMDEFIVGSLRNNLVGLPLDLAALNIARGRDTGMPTFNETRAQLFAQTGSSWLKPYASWAELAANLKNPMTIVNLIAAYGTHADILNAPTLEDKRTVAFNLVFGGNDSDGYTDDERTDFLHGRDGWTAENSGLNDIDLWVGGLAERIMPFGGMLGSTFTAIFEAQLEALQFGDRFYYLSRTQGQNFLNELEQNSFSKMLIANTSLADPGADGIRGTSDDIIKHHIGVDSFAKYDFVLEVNKLNQLVDDPMGIDPLLQAIGLGKVVRDDPTTDAVETNYLRFTGGEHVVVGGTAGNDTIITDDGDDGIWGDAGDDFIQSGFGVDLVNGGAGNDIILDAGDEGDFLKGEDGDDVMGTSSGLDILMGGQGKDVMFLGADASEIFGGEGDDFIMGGEGADFLMGNEGNDWIEGGNGFDGIAGDNTELFFNSRIIGHDVMFAGSEEQDFDAESGDDIMVQGESVMRNEGMFGFDWVAYKGVQTAADADMRIQIFTTVEQDILRNRFDKVEALSGWEKDDQLRGDDRVAGTSVTAAGANEGIFDRDGLDQAGINRIAGLEDLVTLAEGQLTWEQGNILLGGGGSDSMTGGGGDDILDGDRWLNVRIRITDAAGAENTVGNEIATVDTLKHVFTEADGVEDAWLGKSLFELLVARVVVPAQMHIVREILDGNSESDVDVAVFGDDRDQYTITQLEDGSVRVAHTGFGNNEDVLLDDGTDTLHNIEVLRFRDGDFTVEGGAAIGVPAISDSTPLEGQAMTVDLGGIEGAVGPIAVQWRVSLDGTTWTDIPGATDTTFMPEDLPGILQGAQTGLLLQVVATYTNAASQVVTSTSSATAPVGWNWTGLPGDENDFAGTEGDDVAVGGADRDDLEGNGGADNMHGGAGDDRLRGGEGADSLDGGAGEDRVIGGNGDDVLRVDFNAGAGGQDIIEGDLGMDTLEVIDTAAASNFTIMTRAVAESLGITLLEETSEIVITRNGINQGSVVAEIATIEEIVINTVGAPSSGTVTMPDGDTITIVGDFTSTSLLPSTITINGSAADDTVDLSAFASAHRVVFRSAGGNDTIIGNIRAQDVIDLPGTGETSVTHGAHGMVTVSRGGASVTFDGSGAMPTVPGLAADDDAAAGGFFLTASDLAGLKNLVNGRPAFEGDDDTAGATGVRTLSGEGNNVDNPLYGTAGESFIRLTDARYGDFNPTTGNRDINPIFDGLDPREISNILGEQEAGLAKSAVNANILFMAFGQYFDHGLDFLPKSSASGMIEIGGPGMSRGPGSDNPADLTRAAVDHVDANGVPQHVNMTSPFVDQNQAYGSHELVGQFLRESDGEQGFGMRLLQGEPDPSDPDFTLLPTLRDVILHHWEANTIFEDPGLPGGAVAFRTAYAGLVDGSGAIDGTMVRALAGNFLGSGQPLLLDANPFINLLDHRVAGDGRANENFALTSIHTIWARNHNFHVENLIDQGFVGTAEEVFQAAKMLNESDYQRVVFQEFADKLIGGIRSADGGTDNHGWDGYNDEVDSRISHEFASAVYRVGHSLIGQTLQVMGADGQPIEVPLFDAFLNPTNEASAFTGPLPPGYVPQPGYAQHGVAAIMEGTATQLAEEVDFNIVDAVRNDLVRINADLFAFNVARGWDVGLGTLNQVRAGLAASNNIYIAQAVGLAGDLSPYTSWDDFQDRNGLSDTVIAQFKAAYPDLVLSTAEDIAAFVAVNPDIDLLDGPNGTKIVKGIDRVDLWVGGLAEQHINGGMVGQTFWVVLHEQLDRLQEGDRFYYLDRFENFDFYGTFGEDTTFSNIIARNTSLTGLDASIFDAVNDAEEEEDGGDDNDGDGDTDNGGDNDDDGDNDGDNDGDTGEDTGGETDEDEEDTDEDDDEETDEDDDNDDDDVDSGTDDDVGVPPLAASGIIAGTAIGEALFGTAEAENIMGLGGRDMIFAGAGADNILAGAGNDIVFGDGGDDRIFGESGDDFVEAGAGNDFVVGGTGDDVVRATAGDGNDVYYGDDVLGGVGTDTLDMSAILADAVVDLGSGPNGRGIAQSSATGTDVLWNFENFVGGSGDDVVIAGRSANVMDGGVGDDTYTFLTTEDADGDVIASFEPGDKIDLSQIDANGSGAGNGTFTLVSGAFTAVGQLAISLETGSDGDFTVIEGNTAGDAGSEFTIKVRGHHTLTADDFQM